jgi:hypothetical protein
MIIRRWLPIFLLTVGAMLANTAPAAAQFWPLVGGRAVSRDGKWLAPVTNPLLSSDEEDHLVRGSVYAWDLSTQLGAPVYAMAAGNVIYAGCNNAGGYGCWALVQHDDGYSSIYAHMMDEGGGKIWVNPGERVTAWTVLGRVGWTGLTSFGPHVHWEIRHDRQGRLRIDRFFSRSAIAYCKFCAGQPDGSVPVADLAGARTYAQWLFSREALVAALLFAVALLLFFRPEIAVIAVQGAGLLVYKFLSISHASFDNWFGWRKRHWIYLAVILVIPASLCGSATAFGIWMADAGIRPAALVAFWRYGVYPLLGGGYQSGARYSAVWGAPCSGVGTLGRTCNVDEITAAGMAWREEVNLATGANPVPVVIPRISGRFGIDEARLLLPAMHAQQGLVILDVASDFQVAHRAIDELTSFGLDGVAIDLEYVEQVKTKEIRALAGHLAARRQQAGLNGEGVLLLWNVFHTMKTDAEFAIAGVRVVPVFTGYGNTATKLAGLATTQRLFDVQPADLGLMAFDKRWPINTQCKSFDTQRGFDCQNWLTLFADPVAQQVGWWVQQ